MKEGLFLPRDQFLGIIWPQKYKMITEPVAVQTTRKGDSSVRQEPCVLPTLTESGAQDIRVRTSWSAPSP